MQRKHIIRLNNSQRRFSESHKGSDKGGDNVHKAVT